MALCAIEIAENPKGFPGEKETRNMIRGLMMGCPGSGKGTLSRRLTKDFPVHCLSTGDLLREHIQQQTPLGISAASLIQAGDYVPDALMIELVQGQLESLNRTHWFLDGFPRTVPQARGLSALLQSKKLPLTIVFNLDVPHDVILQRIQDRWIHAPSGRVYNLSYNPPRTPGKDDLTGEPLTKRSDDNVSIVAKRLVKYNETTLPLLDFYDKLGLLHSFKGSSSDEIYPQLKALLVTKGMMPRKYSASFTTFDKC